MNWDAVAAVGQLLSAVAVIATLIYLARQIRQSNRQALLASFQNTFDALNAWCALVSESADLAPIIMEGRRSYATLSDADRFRFDHVHVHLLNIVESHLYQAQQTAMDEDYRRWAVENLEGIVREYLSHPGTREFWNNAGEFFPADVRQLVDANIGDD